MKRKDITQRKDIELLVNSFYDKVKQDPEIGPIFSDVAHVNWEKHLPVMYDFWENIIFQTGNYTGNPMTAHFRIHEKHPFTKAHFTRWLALFQETLNDCFEGQNTELARQRALSIATVMEIKLIHTQQKGQQGF
jgi:hemoglobin